MSEQKQVEQTFDLQSATVDEILDEFMRRLQKAMPEGFILQALSQAMFGILLKKGILDFEELVDAVVEIDHSIKEEIKKQQGQIVVPGASFDPNLVKKVQEQQRRR